MWYGCLLHSVSLEEGVSFCTIIAVNTHRQELNLELSKAAVSIVQHLLDLLPCCEATPEYRGGTGRWCPNMYLWQYLSGSGYHRFGKAADKPRGVCWLHSTETLKHFNWVCSCRLNCRLNAGIWFWFYVPQLWVLSAQISYWCPYLVCFKGIILSSQTCASRPVSSAALCMNVKCCSKSNHYLFQKPVSDFIN